MVNIIIFQAYIGVSILVNLILFSMLSFLFYVLKNTIHKNCKFSIRFLSDIQEKQINKFK